MVITVQKMPPLRSQIQRHHKGSNRRRELAFLPFLCRSCVREEDLQMQPAISSPELVVLSLIRRSIERLGRSSSHPGGQALSSSSQSGETSHPNNRLLQGEDRVPQAWPTCSHPRSFADRPSATEQFLSEQLVGGEGDAAALTRESSRIRRANVFSGAPRKGADGGQVYSFRWWPGWLWIERDHGETVVVTRSVHSAILAPPLERKSNRWQANLK